MPFLGPPNRGNDPLHVFAMAAGLIAAAVAGALIGFALDLGSSHGGSNAPPVHTEEAGS